MNKTSHSQIFVNNINDLKNQNNFFSPFTTSLLWIEDKPHNRKRSKSELKCKCKADIFSMFNLQKFQSQLVDTCSLALLPEINSCCKYICFVIEKHLDMENQMLLILHCDNLESLRHFFVRLYSGKCLCLLYSISEFYPKTQAFLFGHKSEEKERSVTTKNISCRQDIQNQYGFRFDCNDSLCYYI